MLAVGFALREYAHALAAHDWVVETANRMGNPEGPPACVFDCAHRLSAEAATLGWFAVALMALGVLLLVWSSVKLHRR